MRFTWREPVRPRAVLAALCLSLTVITMNVSLLNVGLPTLARPSDPGYGVLVSASRQAFVSGLHLAVWITSGVALGSAAAVWLALRPGPVPTPVITALVEPVADLPAGGN